MLYIHGTPSSAMEASLCAAQVRNAGGKLYAFDRPGFGYSDPYTNDIMNSTKDEPEERALQRRLEYVCNCVWELIVHLNWSKFSIIGVSGGGFITLGVLQSYLNRKQHVTTMAKLEAVAIIAGIYGPVGSDGMMKNNQDICKAVNGKNTWKLFTIFGISSIMSKILPRSALQRLFKAQMSQMPQSDQEALSDPIILDQFCDIMTHAMRQGPSWAAPLDISLCMSSKPILNEESLKSYYVSSNDNNNDDHVPFVSIFHGKKDMNVPVTHGMYVHEEIFQKKSKLFCYEEDGHASILCVGNVRDEVAKAVLFNLKI